MHVLPQRCLNTVVNRSSDWKEHLICTDVLVNAWKCGCRKTIWHTWQAEAQGIAGVQSIACVVSYRGSGSNGAINGSTSQLVAPKLRVSRRDGGDCVGRIKRVRRAHMVRIDSEQVMR